MENPCGRLCQGTDTAILNKFSIFARKWHFIAQTLTCLGGESADTAAAPPRADLANELLRSSGLQKIALANWQNAWPGVAVSESTW